MAIRWYEHLDLPADGVTAANACLGVDPPRPPGTACEFFAAADRLSLTAQTLRDALRRLDAIAADDSVWRGEAADRFRNVLEDPHRTRLDQVPDRYDGYARALRGYAAALDGHQASIASARAGTQEALDAYGRIAASTPGPSTRQRLDTSDPVVLAALAARNGAAADCAAAATRFQSAYNAWIDSALRCQRAVKTVDSDRLHNPHGAHAAVDVIANVAGVMSNLTAALALAALPWPPVAIFFLEVSSAFSLVQFGADVTRAAAWHEKLTVGNLAFDALGSIPIVEPAREAVRAGRALRSAGLLDKSWAGLKGAAGVLGDEARGLTTAARDLRSAGLWQTLRHPDPKAVATTLAENWEVQDVLVNGASIARAAYDDRDRDWRSAAERTAFSVVLGPAGPPAAAGVDAWVDAGTAKVSRELGNLPRRLVPKPVS